MLNHTQKGRLQAVQEAHIPLDGDFHKLDSYDKDTLHIIAQASGYRKPANANGSLGCYFYNYVKRLKAKSSLTP